ncbi:hypothetical protein SAMN05192544_110512 [Paraburkholderia hospita]|jgi:hypothetical protein|nr:hypothetical protein PMI06_007942 [Burkholderia sp. BT03]SEI28049.1 hypothetical protein SAMN05192544_110512 [Paraburkholderia hospita]SKC71498.1 hypothetical protein SAMN06266956_2230 [Paraburkholderia hospita]
MEAASIVCLPLFFAFRANEKSRRTNLSFGFRSPGIALTRNARMHVQRLQRDIMFMLTLCITHTVPNTRNIAASTV